MSFASSQSGRRLTGALSILISAVLGAALVTAQPAAAAKGGKGKSRNVAVAWAPADTATIHPGVQTYTDGAQCTANFVFTDSAGKVYVGQAAHCAGTGGATETNGCDSGSLPLGTRVTFNEGGVFPVSQGEQVGAGTLVYSSWLTMQQRNENDANTCDYNDFALIEVDAADVSKVNPTIPFWGGPVGLNTAGTAAGDTVYSYGNSSLRGDADPLSPKQGTSLGTDSDGWNHQVYTATPGIPGDSGSAFLDAEGNALGVLSTVQIAPLAGSNGVGDLAHELAYAQQFGGFNGLTLAPGTEPFSPSL
jgi:hypothetical protein